VNETDRSRWIATHILPHEGEVRAWLRARASSLTPADIDDLLQETYARLWRADLATIENGRGYLFIAVRNLVLEEARRARIVPMERMAEIESLRLVSDEPGPERTASARQQLEQLWRIVATLPAQCRKVFELRYLKDLSHGEIARALGIAPKTVDNHRAKALARIGEGMKEEHFGRRGAAPVAEEAREHDDGAAKDR
jgi:RNA polymerase sigma factor (sigma-70 family)